MTSTPSMYDVTHKRTNYLIDKPLADVQATIDTRQLPIKRVGIRRLKWPIMWQAVHGVVHTVAEFEMTVSLSATQKGTHMSRFIEALNEMTAAAMVWNILNAKTFVLNLLNRLESEHAFFVIQFDIFLPKTAPISQTTALMNYSVTLRGQAHNQAADLDIEVCVPVTSLCPCSKKIADFGAHNQRSHIHICGTIQDKFNPLITLEEMINWAEESASSALYPLLKRADEKYVTEYAYNNPRFVEDLVREIALIAQKDGRLTNICIEAENFESIHNHSAYALIEVPNPL